MTIPFIDLKTQYKELEKSVQTRFQKVFDHGQFIMGPEVVECEKALAEYTGSKHALTCSSGTDAQILALMALEIGPGDEVIVPGFSFIATAEVVVLVGATPVFVDIEKDTYNIDVSQVAEAITEKTKAIMPVGLFGQTPDIEELQALVKGRGIAIIEDAAQSFGATHAGKKSCQLTEIGCTSFFPAKPLGCYGDGGAVFTDSDEIYEKLISLRIHGQSEEHRYLHPRIGINGRMDTLQCAVILSKLEKFAWEVEERQRVANTYDRLLEPVSEWVKTPVVREGRQSAWAQYTLWVDRRDDLRKHLGEQNVPTAVYYPLPMYRQEAYKQWGNKYKLPVSDEASLNVVSLPMHPYLQEETQVQVVEAVKSFYL